MQKHNNRKERTFVFWCWKGNREIQKGMAVKGEIAILLFANCVDYLKAATIIKTKQLTHLGYPNIKD